MFGVLSAITAGLALFIYFVVSSFDDMCGNDNLVEVVSPDGRLKAVTFRRDCGATTGYSTQLSILPANRTLPNGGGNIFISRDDPEVTVRWIDDHHLRISGDTQTQLLRLTEYQGIHIAYD